MKRCSLLLALLSACAVCAAQTTNGKSSRIPVSQLAKMRKSGLVFIVPTYVPAGYSAQSVSINPDKDKWMRSYVLRYRNGKGGTFDIQGASDGIGSLMFDLPGGDVAEATGTMKVPNPVLGKVEMEYLVKGKERQFLFDWIEVKNGWPRHHSAHGRGIDRMTAKRIVEGLRRLK